MSKTGKALLAQVTLVFVALAVVQQAHAATQYNYIGSVEGAASADISGYQFFGVAADSQGRIYSSDWTVTPPATFKAQVKVYSAIDSPGGSQLLGTYGQYGAGGLGAGFFAIPMAITLDATGRLFVADYGGFETVEVFDPFDSGTSALFQFGTPAELTGAIGLSFDRLNRLYVPEYAAQSVSIYSDVSTPPIAAPAAVVNTNVAGDSFASTPFSVAVDSAGTLYVSDLTNFKVKVFVPLNGGWTSYQYAGALSLPADGPGLAVPAGIAVDSADRVHVLEITNNRLLMFSSRNSGNALIASTGSQGAGPGQFNSALSIATSAGLVYVGDLGNSRIQVFSLGESGDSGGGSTAREGSSMTLRIDRVKKKKRKRKRKSASTAARSKKKKRNTSIVTVGYRERAKLSGKLLDTEGKAISNADVSVFSRSYRPGTVDIKLKGLKTESDGGFKYEYGGRESKKMIVRFEGDSTHNPVERKVTYLMRDKVTLKAKKAGKRRYILSGRVASAGYQYRNRYAPYKLVEISFRKPGESGAHVYRVLRANRKTGRFRTLVKPRRTGKQLFRATALGGYVGAYKDSSSRTVRIWQSRGR